MGDGYDGPDALRVVAGTLREIRFLPRGPRFGGPQGQGGRRADPEDDGRLPRQSAQGDPRFRGGEDQRFPDARNARREDRREDRHRAGPQQRAAMVHRRRHGRFGASLGHGA